MLTQKQGETLFEYWISFWPTAPLFGVAWRFEKMMPGAEYFSPSRVAAQMASASAEEAQKAADEAAVSLNRIVEAETEIVEHAAHAMAESFRPAAPDPASVEEAEEVAPQITPSKPTALYEAPPAEIDDLKKIKGVGPKLETLLNGLGVYRFDQIAAFSEADLVWIDQHLATFKGRPFRDDWIAQAKALA